MLVSVPSIDTVSPSDGTFSSGAEYQLLDRRQYRLQGTAQAGLRWTINAH